MGINGIECDCCPYPFELPGEDGTEIALTWILPGPPL
jgi:hypothetical protein